MGLQSIQHGNEGVKALLTSFLQKKRIPAVSLFYGPAGSGKSFFAYHFIQDILCMNPRGVNCCHECMSCRTVKANTSPDLQRISSSDSTSIKIEDIKNAQDFSVLQPVYSDRKVIWIEDAHLLTTEAFNSILKALEEPNLTTIFVLTTSKLDSILPTVRSRSTAISFKSYGEAEVKKILENNSCEESLVTLLSKIGGGNLKKTLSYLDPLNLDYRKKQIESFLALVQQSSFFAPYQTKEEVLSFVSNSQTLVKDVVQVKLNPTESSIVNIDYWEPIFQFSKKIDRGKITEIWDLLLQAEMDLNRVNVNIKAYFELLSVSLKNIVLFC
jgi:DNA polymerase III gamma/tau subunit